MKKKIEMGAAMRKRMFMAFSLLALLLTITACGDNMEEESSGIIPEISTDSPDLSDAEPEDAKESETEAEQTEDQPTASAPEGSD